MRASLVLALAVSFLTTSGLAAPGLESSIRPLLPSPTGPLGPVVSLLGNVGNFEPPPLLYTPIRSPQCAKSNGGNGGTLQCCRAMFAGDLPPVEFLAGVYGYKLNPNDINGIMCDDHIETCPGVRVCCEVTALNPLVSLYCADYNPPLPNPPQLGSPGQK